MEGGKGVAVSNGNTAGHWALGGGIGTISAVNADSYDADGKPIPQVYHARTRRERHEELIAYAVKGALAQARKAFDITGGKGRIHANILWEMGGAERVITEVLEQAKGLINGITCGAGMPYRLSDIAARFNVHYYPIISSARAFSALWKRAYHKTASLLGGVVYEDPWLAGGHNGLSNSENPQKPEDPYPRVVALRKTMNEFGLEETPIIMAGGVWWLEEWAHWLDNKEIGPIAFQFGTRPLLTKESPIPETWKQKLLTLKEGDVYLNRFSPTGFYSSAVDNAFLHELKGRTERQVAYTTEAVGEHIAEFGVGPRKRIVYLTHPDRERALSWERNGFHRGTANAGCDAGVRHAGKGAGNPGGSVRVHGLPQHLPVFQLVAARAGFLHQQARRPAQLLHPEDAAGHRACGRRRGGAGEQPDVLRP